MFANFNLSWRFVVRFLCVSLLFMAVVFGIAYRAIRATVYRRASSLKWCKKVKEYYTNLVGRYGARTVSFKTSDGIKLSGLLITRPQAKRVVLVCHGYWMAKENMRHFVDLFPDDSLLLFDFRAHGASEGDLISIGYHEKKDVRAAVAFLRSHKKTKQLPIVGCGLSMGAATLLTTAAEGQDFKALILDSSFADLGEQVGHAFSNDTGLPATVFMPVARVMYEYIAQFNLSDVSPVRSLQKVSCPLLIIHSEDDEYISVDSARKLYAKSGGYKELWLVKNSKHGYASIDYPKDYADHASNFLDRCA